MIHINSEDYIKIRAALKTAVYRDFVNRCEYNLYGVSLIFRINCDYDRVYRNGWTELEPKNVTIIYQEAVGKDGLKYKTDINPRLIQV